MTRNRRNERPNERNEIKDHSFNPYNLQLCHAPFLIKSISAGQYSHIWRQSPFRETISVFRDKLCYKIERF